MGIPIFERFADMVERLPTKAVIGAIELERQMLEDDLARKRTMPLEDVRSIIAFCNFLENGNDIARGPKIPVPIQHIAFYRQTVKRLVEGGELAPERGALFDAVFTLSAFNSLKKVA